MKNVQEEISWDLLVVQQMIGSLVFVEPLQVKLFLSHLLLALCPNDCSGNGVCNEKTCECIIGWIGIDCSQRKMKR